MAAFVGQSTLASWGVSLPALLLAAGLVLLLVALQAVLSQYNSSAEHPAEPPSAAPATRAGLALSPLAFPNIITPYGTAALILLMAASDQSRDLAIFGIFLVVMVLNLVAMWFARPILKYGSGILQVLGAVLGVLQVALAVQMLLLASRMLGILPPLGS